jgi:hypothetical protein
MGITMTKQQITDVVRIVGAHAAAEADPQVQKELRQLQTDLSAHFTRTPEDYRNATLLAVEASKNLMQIGVAVLAVIAAFHQFGVQQKWENLSLYALWLAAALTVFSLIAGMIVVSRAYKRGEGIEEPDQTAWTVQPLRTPLGFQSTLGLFALLTIVIVVFVSGPSQTPDSVKIRLPGRSTLSTTTLPLTVNGTWTTLQLQQANGFTFTIDPAQQPFVLEFE